MTSPVEPVPTPVPTKTVTSPMSAPRRRLLFLSLLAALVGVACGFAAYWLFLIIRLVSNFAFYQRFSLADLPESQNHLGLWILPLPMLGALIVGLMAKYGSKKIRGHGLPETMDAVLFNQSRVQPRVAILKPTSVAIAIGTGCWPVVPQQAWRPRLVPRWRP